MRRRSLLRVGLASAIVTGGALGIVLAACGDDDNGVVPGKDSGTDVRTDTGPTIDSGTDTGVDAGPPNPKLTVVNAATDLGPGADLVGDPALQAVRICFALGQTAEATQVSPLPPQPDRQTAPPLPAGLYIGTGGALQSYGIDLSPFVLVPYLMNTAKMVEKGIVKPGEGQTGYTCDEILANGANLDGSTFAEGVDYWKLAPIPAGTFSKGKSYVLVLTGCTGDSAKTADECGEGFTPDGGANAGNLKARVYEVDRATEIPADKMGVQFIHASAAADFYLSDTVGVTAKPAIVNEPNPITHTAKPLVAGDASVPYATKTELVQLDGVNVGTDLFAINRFIQALDVPLTTIQASSFPTGVPDGGTYRNGASFTFLVVGDPLEPRDAGGGLTNGKTFHYLGFPNDPEITSYKP